MDYLLLSILLVVVTVGVSKRITRNALQKVKDAMNSLAKGELDVEVDYSARNLVGQLASSINITLGNLRKSADFAKSVGEGNFDHDYEPVSAQDSLGSALSDMRLKLKEVAEEDRIRNWTSAGLAEFVEVLRKNHKDLASLSDAVIHQLVKYTNMIQGGVFILNETEKSPYLEMVSCFAYDRKKFVEKRFGLKQSLVGQVFMEQKTRYMTDIPSSYVDITSGLGQATPRYLIIVPIKANERVEGVIELASFEEIEPYKIEFVERLCESIAHTIASVKGNQKMKMLLENSERQAEKMAAQEYKMRKSNEELAMSHEEMERQKQKMEKVLEEAKVQEASLTTIINNTDSKIMAFDHEMKLIIFNDAFKAQFTRVGHVIESGIDVLSIFEDEQLKEEMKGDFERALEGYRFKSERKIVHQGHDYIFDINFSPILSEGGKLSGSSVFMEDITDYIKKKDIIRKSEQQAKQKSKMLEQTTDSVNRSGLATAEFDMDGHVVDANMAFVKMFGYDSPREIIGKKHRVFVPSHQKSSPEYKEFWKKLKEGKEPNGEYERKKQDGEPIWISATYNVVKEANGKPAMIIKVAHDVTESHQLLNQTLELTEELKKSEEKIRQQLNELAFEKKKNESMLQGHAEGVIVFDQGGSISFFNKAAEKMFMKEAGKVCGSHISELLDIDIVEKNKELVPCVKTDGVESECTTRAEVTAKVADGLSMLLSIAKGKVGGENYFTAFIQNVSVEQL